MRLLGIDPGLRHTGWGLVEQRANHLRFVASGRVDSNEADPLHVRLCTLYDGLAGVIVAHGVDEAAVEQTVVNRNPGSSLKLGHARGVAMLAVAHAGLPVREYGAKQVKRAVTGTGAALKDQVASMVRILLPGCGEVAGDAADALAVAICHAHHRTATYLRVAGTR